MLRTVSRPFRALAAAGASRFASAAAAKESTGVAGLAVEPNFRQVLGELYAQTLSELEEIPADAEYRKNVEATIAFRREVIQNTEDWSDIEKKIGGGQVEELIQQARDELGLVGKMKEWRAWEGEKVPVQTDKEFSSTELMEPPQSLLEEEK